MSQPLLNLLQAGKLGMDYINVAIMVIDKEYTIRYMNYMCEKLLQIHKEDVVNLNVYDVFPDAPEEVRHLENTVKLEKTTLVKRMPYKFGKFNNYFDLQTHLLKDDEGNTIGALAEFKDVTEFVLNEERLRRSLIESVSTVILLPDGKGVLPFNQAVVDVLDINEITESILLNLSSKQLNVLIIDLSSIFNANDAFYHSLNNLISALRLLGIKTNITGIRPDVAKQMIETDLQIEAKYIFNSLAKALQS